MESRAPGGGPNPAQARAFQDRDVAAIVAELLRHSDARLVRLARQAVVTPRPIPRDGLRAQLHGLRREPVTDSQLDSAETISAAGARICGRPDWEERERLKGGLLERYVHDMVSLRAPGAVRHEHQIKLTRNPHCRRSWSKPKEVVVHAVPFEVYECKWGGHLDQDDINELGDVYVSASDEGVDARPCIAVMTSETDVRLKLEMEGVELDEVLYISDNRDLQELGQRPPSRRFR
jgi:hypothetical protein